MLVAALEISGFFVLENPQRRPVPLIQPPDSHEVVLDRSAGTFRNMNENNSVLQINHQARLIFGAIFACHAPDSLRARVNSLISGLILPAIGSRN